MTKNKKFVLVMILPWIIGFSFLFLIPVLLSIFYATTKFNVLESPKFIGLENFKFMFFTDPYFGNALKNSLWVIAVIVPARLLLALYITYLLNIYKRIQWWGVTILSLPIIIPTVGSLVAFKYILNPIYGPINKTLEILGIDNPPLWFITDNGSRWGYLLITLWTVGDSILLFLAGVTRINNNLLDAARLDNISTAKQFRYIILPHLNPILIYSIVTGVVIANQNFTNSFILNIGQNTNSPLYFLSTHIYVEGYKHFQMGYAAALSWFMTLFLVVSTVSLLIIFKHLNRKFSAVN